MPNNIFTFYIRGQSGTYFPVYLTDQYTCDLEESYIGNLLTVGDLWQNQDIGGASYRKHWEITGYTNPTYDRILGMYIVDKVAQDGMCVCYSGNTNDVKWAGGIGNLTVVPYRSTSEYLCQRYEGWFSTNVPIFDTQEHAETYMASDDVAVRQNLIRTYAVNYAPRQSYFPMEQDENGKFPSAVRNFIKTTWDTDTKYFLCYMYNETSTTMKYYIETWDKTSTGRYYAILEQNGYQFRMTYTNTISDASFKSITYQKSSENVFQAQPSGTFESKFNPANSSKYDASVSYLSNFELRTQDGQESVLKPPVVAPVENPNKLMSAQLNLLRRRLLQLVMPPAYENFFNYTIEEGKAWVTSVKRDEWLAAFGNLDIYVPDTLEGYPVVLVNAIWDW